MTRQLGNIIFFEFAGRRANMEIQRPHIERLLHDNPGSEFHLWDLTREPEDQAYLKEWALSDSRVRYMGQLHPGHPIRCIGPHRRGHRRCTCMIHKPPYEMPYRWYAKRDYSDETVFVKFDDDVLWMDTARFPEVIEFLETHPRAVASANVVNNAVCAKYEPELHALVRKEFRIGGHGPENDKAWWGMHMSPEFAELSHDWLLFATVFPIIQPFRTRPGEKISINFIVMKFPTLRLMARLMREGRLGDEGTVDSLLPWIVPNFRVAHLSFGPQETRMDFSSIRNAYAELEQ